MMAKGIGGDEKTQLDWTYIKWDAKTGNIIPCSREETTLDYWATLDEKGNLIYVPDSP